MSRFDSRSGIRPFIISVMCVLFVCSCAREDVVESIGNTETVQESVRLVEKEFIAGGDAVGTGTVSGSKVVTNPENYKSFVWQSGDGIKVFDGISNELEAFTTTENGPVVTFTGKVSEAATGPYYAISPYQPSAVFSKDEILIGETSCSGYMTVKVPQVQTASANSIPSDAFLTAAVSADNSTFSFKNVVGLVKFRLKASDAGNIESISLYGNENESLAGSVSVAFDSEGELHQTAGTGEQYTTVTLTGTFSPETDYYFATRPCEFNSGFTIIVRYTDGSSKYVKATDKPENGLQRNSILNLKEVPLKSAFTAGDGTETDPYLIYTVEEFRIMRNFLRKDSFTSFRLAAENLDMTDVAGWIPVNQLNAAYGIHFDGNGHSISNFKCEESTKWASIFGVLHGSVKDLTLVNPVLVNSYNATSGILCAWAGNVNGVLSAEITNVHIVNGRMEMATPTQYFGGMIGNAVNATIRNCSFDGTVLRSTGKGGTYTYSGGLIGWIGGGDAPGTTVLIDGCSSSGSIETVNGRSTGGLVGFVYPTAEISNSHSSMTVTAGNDVAGGLLGTGSGKILNCYAEGDVTCGVTSSSSKYSYAGGLIGYVPSNTSLILSDCHYTGTVKGSGSVVGGLIGQCLTAAEIRRCYADATVSAYTIAGGLIGRTSAMALVVGDCYAKGSIQGASTLGGLLGDTYKDNSVRNCYSTMSVTGTFALGGLIARASNASNSSVQMVGQNFNITVSGCISWGSLTSTATSTNAPSSHYSGGAVIGYTAERNTLSGNYRKPGMSFSYYPEAKYNDLYDQPDTGADAPLLRNYTDKYYFPYHGKAAADDATVSSTARLCGWDETVWDLSGDYPVLNVPDGGGK